MVYHLLTLWLHEPEKKKEFKFQYHLLTIWTDKSILNQNQESPLPENDFFLKFNPKNKPFQVEHKPTMYIFLTYFYTFK
jgi:hypothetical protein